MIIQLSGACPRCGKPYPCLVCAPVDEPRCPKCGGTFESCTCKG